MSRSLTECGFSQYSLPLHVHSFVQHNCSDCMSLCSNFYLCMSRWDLAVDRYKFSTFSLTPILQWDPMFDLVTCDDFHTFVCHWARLASFAKLASHEGSFANDLSFLWSFFSVPLGSYNIAVNALAADRAASLLLVPRIVRAMKWSTLFASQRCKLFSSQFQTRRKLSHIQLVNEWQDVRCRTADQQQHKSNAQEQTGAYLLYW